MIVNKRAPVSLSMRMRADATLPEISSSRESIRDKATMLKSRREMSIRPHADLTMSKEEMLHEMAEQELKTEKTSGIIDYVASSGVFADRTVMTLPSSACVRCGNHASTCMSCTEYLAEEALTFYRKTRARGAASLFANAITQTGVTKVVKYILFTMWRNGYRERKWSARKKDFKANVSYRRHFLLPAMEGWKKFNTMTIRENKDKKIEALEKRVETLEQLVQQATNLQKNAEAQAKLMKGKQDNFEATIEKQAAQIEELSETLTKERSRVVALSTLAKPIMKLQHVTTEMCQVYLDDMQGNIYNHAKTQQPAFNYMKNFNAEDFELTLHSEAKRRKKGKKIDVEEIDSTIEIVEVLLTWASAKSRDANSITDPESDKSVDFLPKYKKIGDMPDLKNGSQLIRCVLALIWDLPSAKGSSTLKLPQQVSEDKMEGDEEELPQKDILAKVKGSLGSPFETITCALELANTYLHLPKFHVGDVVSCRNDIYIAILGYLMIASASPAQHPNSLGKIGQIITEFEKKRKEMNPLNPPIQIRDMTSIHKKLMKLHGESDNDLDDNVSISSTVVDVEANVEINNVDMDSNEMKEDGEAKDGISVKEKEENNEAKDNDSTSVASTSAAPIEEIPAEDAPLSAEEQALQKYTSLCSAIDSYLSHLGDFDSDTMTYDNSNSILTDQVDSFFSFFTEVNTLQGKVKEHTISTDEGFKLANQVRAAVSKYQQEMLFSELKWLE